MTTVYKYRIYCNTDNKWEYVWSETAPTTCPTNTAHSVNSTSVSVVETSSTSVVEIKEESTPTGGHFSSTTVSFDCPPNTTTGQDTSWPINISALNVDFITDESQRGDIVEMMVGKNTIIGALAGFVNPCSTWTSQNYTAGQIVMYDNGTKTLPYTCTVDTVSNEAPTDTNYWAMGFRVAVSSTVVQYTKVGFYLNFFDGVNSDDMGRVLMVDTVNNYVFMENNPTNSFSPVSPTYVRQTVYQIKDYEIGPPWEREIGASKIGGSHVPKCTKVRIEYTNKSLTDTKRFVGHVEYLY